MCRVGWANSGKTRYSLEGRDEGAVEVGHLVKDVHFISFPVAEIVIHMQGLHQTALGQQLVLEGMSFTVVLDHDIENINMKVTTMEE